MFYSLSYAILFIGDKISSDRFKDKITHLLKAHDRLKFAQDVALNCVQKKVKPRYKISYELFKEEDGNYPLIDIYPYPTLIQLKYFLVGIHHCVTVFGKWVFDSDFPFAIPLTKDYLYYCCINDNETKLMNVDKVVLKATEFSINRIIKASFRIEDL